MNPVLQTLASRKSVRRYTGAEVGRDVLKTLVHAGMAAPCSWDKRCWFFVVVDDPQVIVRLVEGLPYAKMVAKAGHAIVVAGDMTLAHGGAETPYWIQDCSATTENILLAAEALGLGACWTAAYPRLDRVAFVQTTLGLPPHVIPLSVIAVGHPTGEDKPKDKIDEERLYWNHWGTR